MIGDNIPVTNSNRLEYIYRVADYHLDKKLAPLTSSFVYGVADMIGNEQHAGDQHCCSAAESVVDDTRTPLVVYTKICIYLHMYVIFNILRSRFFCMNNHVYHGDHAPSTHIVFFCFHCSLF